MSGELSDFTQRRRDRFEASLTEAMRFGDAGRAMQVMREVLAAAEADPLFPIEPTSEIGEPRSGCGESEAPSDAGVHASLTNSEARQQAASGPNFLPNIRQVKIPALPSQSIQVRARECLRFLWVHGLLTQIESDHVSARIRNRVVIPRAAVTKHHPDCEALECGRADCGRPGPCYINPKDIKP